MTRELSPPEGSKNPKLEPGQDCCVLDVETTGLDPEQAAIIAIGAVRIQDGRVRDTWETLVNPGEPYLQDLRDMESGDSQERALQVHGLTANMLTQEPTLPDVIPQLEHFRKGLVPLAHNASFDSGFFHHDLTRNQIPIPPGLQEENWFCSLRHARLAFPEMNRFSLDHLALKLGEPPRARDDKHDALGDALLLAKCWIRWGRPADSFLPGILDEHEEDQILRPGAPVIPIPVPDPQKHTQWAQEHGFLPQNQDQGRDQDQDQDLA